MTRINTRLIELSLEEASSVSGGMMPLLGNPAVLSGVAIGSTSWNFVVHELGGGAEGYKVIHPY
jgi:hypothetical protein